MNWQTNKGCNQLHLLLAAFPPSRDDANTYRKLVRSCLEAGLDVGAQEERGRSALFVLCEQMATVPGESAPDAPRLVHMLLVGANGHQRASVARKIVSAADRTGRTVFDIVERADHSCLAACRAVLRDASQGVLHHDGSDYGSVTGAAGRRSSTAGSDWEQDRPRSSSALIAKVSQVSGASASLSARSEAESKRRTSTTATYASTASVSSTTRLASNTAYNSSSYLSEEYADAPGVPLLRGGDHGGSGTQYGSTYFSPAVAARPARRAGHDDV